MGELKPFPHQTELLGRTVHFQPQQTGGALLMATALLWQLLQVKPTLLLHQMASHGQAERCRQQLLGTKLNMDKGQL